MITTRTLKKVGALKALACMMVFLQTLALLAGNAGMHSTSRNDHFVPSQEGGSVVFLSTAEAVKQDGALSAWLYKVQPTLFVKNEANTIYGGETPLVVECRPNAIQKLYVENSAYSAAKVLKILLNSPADLASIDLSQFKTFHSLEYIQLVFTFDVCKGGKDACLLATAQGLIIQATDHDVTVLYQLSIPE